MMEIKQLDLHAGGEPLSVVEKDDSINDVPSETVQSVQERARNVIHSEDLFQDVTRLREKLISIKKQQKYGFDEQLICQYFDYLPKDIQDALSIVVKTPVSQQNYGSFLLQLSHQIKEKTPFLFSFKKKPLDLYLLTNQARELIHEYKRSEKAKTEKEGIK